MRVYLPAVAPTEPHGGATDVVVMMGFDEAGR
jgi:hypothetical protein